MSVPEKKLETWQRSPNRFELLRRIKYPVFTRASFLITMHTFLDIPESRSSVLTLRRIYVVLLLAQHAEDENESFFMPMHKTSKNVCKNV